MKRKIHCRLLVAFLFMIFMIGLMPVTALAGNSTGIKVDGVDILTAPNYTVECGEGKAVYDPSANILTLDNVTITRTDTKIPISFYGGDLTILLKGKNTITTPDGGIVGYRGNVIFKGEENASLTINSTGLFGVYCDDNDPDSGHITVDGTTLNINTTSNNAQGLHALRTVSIKNNANVTLTGTGTNYFCIYAKEDLSITDSTVTAKLNSTDGGNTIVSHGNLSIEHSTVNVTTVANNIALATTKGRSISDGSQVTVTSNGNADAVYTAEDLTISDSIVKAEGSQRSMRSKGAMSIINSKIEATCTGDPVVDSMYSMYSEDTISIEENSDVLAIGKISVANGVIIVPSSGTLMDIKVGMKENGEGGTSHFEASPYKETTTLSGLSEYTYVHIQNHAHIYDQSVVSDAYKATDATYEQPASYYKSCACGAMGTETFTSGEALAPVIIAGANGTWQKGTKDGLSFTSNAAFAGFLKVQVDSKDLDGSNYTVKEGSTIVTLKAEYLETLSVGTHTLAIVSKTGTAGTEFTIKGAAGIPATGTSSDTDTTSVPKTGDDSNTALWIGILAAACVVVIGIFLYRKKNKEKE